MTDTFVIKTYFLDDNVVKGSLMKIEGKFVDVDNGFLVFI
jgi:hypothetical protein